MPEETKTYLGDGVYVRDLDYAIVLYTSNGITVQNEIYLERNEISSLLRFLKDNEHLPEVT